ncbi:MAG: hypothetical protein IPO81_00290 [Kouleothrix sp.]|nr:hypothetical protein [Kouleothrix sp.]
MLRLRALIPPAFVAGLAGIVVVQGMFRRYPLTTGAVPYGIVSFELAGSIARARQIVDSWRASGLIANVRPNMWIDSTRFIPCYVATLLLGCLWVADAFGARGARVVRWLAAGQILAGALDLVENTAMLQSVGVLEAGGDPGAWPALAAGCAVLKFALVAAGILAILAGAIAWLRRRLQA